jgi:hypothetical protein
VLPATSPSSFVSPTPQFRDKELHPCSFFFFLLTILLFYFFGLTTDSLFGAVWHAKDQTDTHTQRHTSQCRLAGCHTHDNLSVLLTEKNRATLHCVAHIHYSTCAAIINLFQCLSDLPMSDSIYQVSSDVLIESPSIIPLFLIL